MSSGLSEDAQTQGSGKVDSPCIKVCTLDQAGMCVGCGRRIEEIAAWSRLTTEQQRSICEQAAARLAAYGKR